MTTTRTLGAVAPVATLPRWSASQTTGGVDYYLGPVLLMRGVVYAGRRRRWPRLGLTRVSRSGAGRRRRRITGLAVAAGTRLAYLSLVRRQPTDYL